MLCCQLSTLVMTSGGLERTRTWVDIAMAVANPLIYYR